jgi:hypothetical protein|tara:strand:- start:143 stop:379 length:237 start_codon:yes stop_codon:yes gene_type:complete
MATKIKANIHITQSNNDKLFNQKLNTWRNGWTTITRTVTFAECPQGIWNDYEGMYGYIIVNKKQVPVTCISNNDYDIQ